MSRGSPRYRDAAAIYTELDRMIEDLEQLQRDRRLPVPHGGPGETRAAVRDTLNSLYAGREACSHLQTDQHLGN